MKLTAKKIHFSSTVGGGLTLVDERGVARFCVMFIGTSWGIDKEQDAALSEQVEALINTNPLWVPWPRPADQRPAEGGDTHDRR